MATSRQDDPEEAVRAEVRRHAAAVLGAVGPLDVDRLCRVLERSGTFAPLTDEGWDDEDHQWMVEDLVAFDMDDFHGTADGLITHVPALVDGIILAHVLSSDERRRSMIDLGIDFAVLGRHRFRYAMASGGEARIVRSYGSPEATRSVQALGLPTDDAADREGSLIGPDGWLNGFDDGDLLAVRVSGRSLELGRTGANRQSPPPDAALVAALEIAARRRIDDPMHGEDGYFVLTGHPEHLLLDALAHDPTLLRAPGTPLSAVFEQLALSWDGDTLLWRRPAAA